MEPLLSKKLIVACGGVLKATTPGMNCMLICISRALNVSTANMIRSEMVLSLWPKTLSRRRMACDSPARLVDEEQTERGKPDLPAPHRGYENLTDGKNQHRRGSAKRASEEARGFTKFAFQMLL